MGHENVGTWKQFIHWGPLLALTVILTISWVAINCHIMWWPPHHTAGGFINFSIFLFWIGITLYHYFAACLKGPGFVSFGWKPKVQENADCVQYCESCQGYKAPRSHHCRKCGRCVMKMDHHCPWLNTCCGHYNHANFVLFLFFAPIGCLQAITIIIPSVYRALNFHYYYYHRPNEPLVYLGIVGFIVTMFAIGLAIGVIIAVSMLCFLQIKSILKNETGIESWIIDKARHRLRDEEEGDFVYPYHLGWKENFKQVFRWSGRPKSNGYKWDVVQGCNQFTLTIEQLLQKREKRECAHEYMVIEDYSGHCLPVSKGLRVGCCVPCSDEPRLKIALGDKVMVTRGKKRWLYGQKRVDANLEITERASLRSRGWFPRQCAVEVIDDNMNDKKES